MKCGLLVEVLAGICFVAGAVFPMVGSAQPVLVPLTTPQIGQRLEFGISNLPAASNPFDPDVIRLDATFGLPSGGTRVVPAFWYQAYQRSQVGGYEQDTATGAPGWRLRFLPLEPGNYSVTLTVQTNHVAWGIPGTANFVVPTGAPPDRLGYVGIAPGSSYFQTGDGQPLRLIGENVCWGTAGTYDYDAWFPAMQAAGENYARLWMCPWMFGIEDTATSLVNYSLQPAWQLDYVFQQAEQRGIYLLLCLDYHGMFVTEPDYWGGNNIWPQNPYNVTNGGPCAVANDFFTNSLARQLYEKRLRYLVARYGYSQNLLAWEFFNEIDNDYSFLNPPDVAAWHGAVGSWLHTNDSFGHLVTTSLTGSSDRPEIWSLPQLDFAAYHSYAETPPAAHLAAVAQSFLTRYGKPVMIGEFGTDWRGWARENDVYLRGWRQGIWGGALSGSVGTAMSWWWENIHSENDYPVYAALGSILNRTGWGRGGWTNIVFQSSGAPPAMVGGLVTNGLPFDVLLPLNTVWAAMLPGRLAVPNAAAANYSGSTLNSFVHGIWHNDLKTPFQLSAWLTNNATLVLHLNSVSDGANLTVMSDSSILFSTNLPNLDGTYAVNEEYNTNFVVNLPPGKHLITVTNLGMDWICLDWVELTGVLPSQYLGNWQASPDAIGLRGSRESLLYIVSPYADFPAGATNSVLPLQHGQAVILSNWPAGPAIAEWYDPASGNFAGYTQSAPTNGNLTLPLPDFTADLAGILYPPPVLTSLGMSGGGVFRFSLQSETGGRYVVEQSSNLVTWTQFQSLTNVTGSMTLTDAPPPAPDRRYFRAKRGP